MTFGEEWGFGSNEEESRNIFREYLDAGGNFIDTANYYTNGTSERLLGELTTGIRDQLVLATKFSLNMRTGDPNAGGNHRKCIVQSLEASLKRLKTDYIDLYWLHIWDSQTPIEEVLRALDDLVAAGKVLYLGISDTPAWRVSQANTIAELRGWTAFIALQILYNLIDRTVERDLMPMARAFGIGVTPWSPLAAGLLSGKYGPTGASDTKRQIALEKLSPANLAIVAEVERIAREIGRTTAQVALAWLLRQPGVVSPIIGARTVSQLRENLSSMSCVLTPDHEQQLNAVSRVDLGFPHEFLTAPKMLERLNGGTRII
jgi:aryl-alcohol dehydrogenase-like predicted oxidoreductase